MNLLEPTTSIAEEHEKRSAFFDAVRTEAVAMIQIYWGQEKQPIGIERAAKLTIDRITAKNRWTKDQLTGKPIPPLWRYGRIPDMLTVRRRINEAASQAYYDREFDGEKTLLIRLGWRMYQGERESQYQPRLE